MDNSRKAGVSVWLEKVNNEKCRNFTGSIKCPLCQQAHTTPGPRMAGPRKPLCLAQIPSQWFTLQSPLSGFRVFLCSLTCTAVLLRYLRILLQAGGNASFSSSSAPGLPLEHDLLLLDIPIHTGAFRGFRYVVHNGSLTKVSGAVRKPYRASVRGWAAGWVNQW